MAQHLPEDLEEKVKLFHEFVKARREEEDFEDKMIINIDETPMYFELVPDELSKRKVLKV